MISKSLHSYTTNQGVFVVLESPGKDPITLRLPDLGESENRSMMSFFLAIDQRMKELEDNLGS